MMHLWHSGGERYLFDVAHLVVALAFWERRDAAGSHFARSHFVGGGRCGGVGGDFFVFHVGKDIEENGR